jgi:hypothetical protein
VLTGVLGLPLDLACATLEREGVFVTLEETRSKKGVPDGTGARVVRQTALGENRAVLLYAVFKTEPNEANA